MKLNIWRKNKKSDCSKPNYGIKLLKANMIISLIHCASLKSTESLKPTSKVHDSWNIGYIIILSKWNIWIEYVHYVTDETYEHMHK